MAKKEFVFRATSAKIIIENQIDGLNVKLLKSFELHGRLCGLLITMRQAEMEGIHVEFYKSDSGMLQTRIVEREEMGFK